MKQFVIVAEPWGIERTVIAASKKEAYAAVWDSLEEYQRNNCECLDCVDESEYDDVNV